MSETTFDGEYLDGRDIVLLARLFEGCRVGSLPSNEEAYRWLEVSNRWQKGECD